MSRDDPAATTSSAHEEVPGTRDRRPTTRARRAELVALSVSHIVDDFYQGAVPALVALLVLERHYTYTAATGITLAATILSSVIQPLFGVLSDKYTMRWLAPLGLALAGTGIGLAGLGDSYAWTWIAVAVSGLGVAAYHPDASRSARTASGGTAAGMSWFALGGNVGFALGPTLTTAALVATGLTGSPLLAAPALLTAGALPLVLRRLAGAPASPPNATVDTADAARATPLGPEADETDDWRAFGWLTGVVVTRSVLFFGVVALLALYLQHQFAATPSAASAAVTVLLGTGAAATLVGGRLADRIGRVPAVRSGYALAVAGLVGLVLAPTLGVALTASAVLGFATFLPFSVQVTLGQDYLPHRIGTASGVTLGLAVSAGGLVVPLLGVLADRAGLRLALATLLIPTFVALAITTRLPESAPTGFRTVMGRSSGRTS